MYDFIDRFALHLNHISSNVSKLEEKVPFICCSYFYNLDQMLDQIRIMCDSLTGAETSKWISGRISASVTDMIDMSCGKFNSLSVCKKTVPTIVSTLESLKDVTSVKNSFLIPTMEIMKQLES